ncbi:MAG: tryptophan--tRNA ligase, partial [bacterium]
VSTDRLAEIRERYENLPAQAGGGMGYKESKDILIESLIKFITPLREKRAEIAKDKDKVAQILKVGTEKARIKAAAKMAEVRKKVGLD